MQKILEKYKEEICKNCTADCYNAKGIVVFANKDTICARCVDYKSDKKKIEGHKKIKDRTAKFEKMVMPQLAVNWSGK